MTYVARPCPAKSGQGPLRPEAKYWADTRAVARLTSGLVSTVVHQRPWLVVMEVTHLVTRHQPDQPVAGPCHGADAPGVESVAPLARRVAHGSSAMITVPAVTADLADPLDDPAPPPPTTDAHPHSGVPRGCAALFSRRCQDQHGGRRPWKLRELREISGMPLRTRPMKEMAQRPFMGARRSRRRPFG